MKINLYNTTGTQTGEIQLNPKIFGVKLNPSLIAQAVRVYLGNQRSSHAKSKGRSEVSGTTKKMWSQKHTGNARHSSAKAPQFVGGGKAHGPDGTQNYKRVLSKKMRTAALSSLLSKFAKEKAISAIEKLSLLEPKTKSAIKLIDVLVKNDKVIAKSKKIGLLTVGEATSTRAFRNLQGFKILTTKSLSVYDLSKLDYLICSKKAITYLNKNN